MITSSQRQLRFYFGHLAILVTCSSLIVTPWKLDNLKLVYLWLAGGAVMACAALLRIWELRRIPWPVRLACVLMLVGLCLPSGALNAFKEFAHRDRVMEGSAIKFGEWVRDRCAGHGVFNYLFIFPPCVCVIFP